MTGAGWISIGILRTAILRLHHDWEALPTGARRRWWVGLALGVAGVLALTALLVSGARSLDISGALAWESGVLHWIAERMPISFSTGMWLEGVGNGFVLWGVMLYSAWRAAIGRRPLRAIAILVGYTLVYLHIAFAWWMWDRPRPQFVMDGLASPGGFFHAYPSGHMVQATFAYGLLATFWARAATSTGERIAIAGGFVLLLALVALGRLRIGVHWPSDIVAGTLIGLAWLSAIASALGRAEHAAQSAGEPGQSAHGQRTISLESFVQRNEDR